jgi:heavy metal sensor kinase
VSLSARLSAFFLSALAVVLVGFAVALCLLTRWQGRQQSEERLHAALDTLTAAVEFERDGLEWDSQQRRLNLGGGEPVRWTIHDDRGRLVDHSPDLAEDNPLRRAAPAEADDPGLQTADLGGEPWLLRQRRLRATSEVAGGSEKKYAALLLTAAVPLGPARARLRTLAATLALLAAGLWLLALLGCRRLCRRALRPVTRMADAAAAMKAADRDQRLPVPASGDELEALGRAFNGLLDRLQEAYERQRRFTGDASHQLRTPLAALLGQVEVCLRQPRPPEEYRQVLERVRRQGEHLRRLVEMLLYLARADAEARLDDLTVLDLATWLPEHLESWSAHPRWPDVRVVSAGQSFRVRVQPPLLGQLLDNLLDNACKYSPPGSPVVVRLTGETDRMVLAVEDRGCGLAADDLAHVFEPFYRSAEARRLGRPGVGLGLAVARRIATLFGGELHARSRPGEGSTFELTLPWQEDGP